MIEITQDQTDILIRKPGQSSPYYNISKNYLVINNKTIKVEPAKLFYMYANNKLDYSDLCKIYDYTRSISLPTMADLINNLYNGKILLEDIEFIYKNNTQAGNNKAFLYVGDILLVLPGKTMMLRILGNFNFLNLPRYLGNINTIYTIFENDLTNFFIDEVIKKENMDILQKTETILNTCKNFGYERLLKKEFIDKIDTTPILQAKSKGVLYREKLKDIKSELERGQIMPVGNDGYICSEGKYCFFISKEESPRLYDLSIESAVKMINSGREKHYKDCENSKDILAFLEKGLWKKEELKWFLNKINNSIYDPLITLLNL